MVDKKKDVVTDRAILNDSVRMHSLNDKKIDETDVFIDNDVNTRGSFRLRSFPGRRDSNSIFTSDRRINVNTKNKYLEMDKKLRKNINDFMNNPVVENSILAIIAINSITIGVGTFDSISEDEQIMNILNWSDLVFLIIFTVELSLTIFYMRWKSFTDMWVVFDALIIILSWIFTGGGNQSVQVIRSMRIFRILPRITSLQPFLGAFRLSLIRLGWVAVFQLIIMFIFGVYFTETLGDMSENGQFTRDYFSRLDYTFFTLYQLLTLDDWNEVLREVIAVHFYMLLPIVGYVILAAFIMVNLVVAIICEQILAIDSSKNEVIKIESDMRELERLLYSTRFQICSHLELSGIQSLSNLNVIPEESTGDPPPHESTGDPPPHESTGDPPPLTHQTEGGDIAPLPSFCSKLWGIFVNPADPMHDPKRNLCGNIINNDYVQGILAILVIVNSIFLAIATFKFVRTNPSVHSVFEMSNAIFLIIFTIENGMQLIYHRLGMFKDPWLTFDFILIALCWIFTLSPAFRVLRLVHIFPKVRAIRAMTEILLNSFYQICAIFVVLMIIFYVFGVMCTTLFKDIDSLPTVWFSSLPYSILTLGQIMTMAEWAHISRELNVHVWYASAITSVFLTLSGLITVNGIVALICQAQEDVRDREKEILSLRKSGSLKSYDDRVRHIHEMYAEIACILKQSRENEKLELDVID